MISIRFISFVCLLVSTLVLSEDADSEKRQPESSFFHLCSDGNHEEISKLLKDNPEWANAATSDGETCLHLAGIPGSVELTKVLLDAGANPNVRSTHSAGLRMHPLSWSVYAGHSKVIKLLLENGANVNDDFDSSAEEGGKVTALDICLEILKQFNDGQDDGRKKNFEDTKDVLLQNGAKTYDKVVASSSSEQTEDSEL